MKFLHPYWRMAYIAAPKTDAEGRQSDPFLEIPKVADERSVHLIWRGKHAYLVMNKFPYNAGHILAVPYRAVANLADLTAEERADLMETIVKGQDILSRALTPDAFNVGFNFGKAAGAGIPCHLHCHIVPRWEGDNNFMPVLADTRCLPEAMDAMWERLRAFA